MIAPWYSYGYIGNYGAYPDPDGPFPKPDLNVEAPAGTPITPLGSGVVSGINTPWWLGGGIPAFGQVVTIKLDQPINGVATHMAYLHLGSINPNLQIGSRVDPGTILGYAGSNPENASTGFALYNGDYYGYGTSWSQYVGSPELDPTAFFQAIQSSGLSGINSGELLNQLNSNILVVDNGSNVSGSTPNSDNFLGFDFTRFIDAGVLLLVGIVLVIIGGLLLTNTGVGVEL